LSAIIFVWILYDDHTTKRKNQAQKQRESEWNEKSEQYRLEYDIRQNIAAKDKKSHQERPDDWLLRTNYELRRDGYKCVKYGRHNNLHVHHKMPVSTSPDHTVSKTIHPNHRNCP